MRSGFMDPRDRARLERGMQPRLLAIISAYNESASLPRVLRDLHQHLPCADVVVINDASTDATAAVARANGACVIDLPINLGIGGAVQTGLIFAHRGGYDVAFQLDGDGQHLAV